MTSLFPWHTRLLTFHNLVPKFRDLHEVTGPKLNSLSLWGRSLVIFSACRNTFLLCFLKWGQRQARLPRDASGKRWTKRSLPEMLRESRKMATTSVGSQNWWKQKADFLKQGKEEKEILPVLKSRLFILFINVSFFMFTYNIYQIHTYNTIYMVTYDVMKDLRG